MIPLSRPLIGPEESAAVARVLSSGQLAAGPEVAAFEAEFAAFVGVPHAVAVSNGTTALWLSLWAAGIGPGDEVIVPSFTFAATAGAVLQTGARPVYADIEAATYCISADAVRAHIGPRTAAIDRRPPLRTPSASRRAIGAVPKARPAPGGGRRSSPRRPLEGSSRRGGRSRGSLLLLPDQEHDHW